MTRTLALVAALLFVGCENRTWVVDSRECFEKCALSAAQSRDYRWNLHLCTQDICPGRWEKR